MGITFRLAGPEDLAALTALQMRQARLRATMDPALWALAPEAEARSRAALAQVLTGGELPYPQFWLLAETGRQVLGAVHAAILPVPPIYAGDLGPPGLLMEDACLDAEAPPEVGHALLEATEAELRGRGVRLLLGASAIGSWEAELARAGYAPLTLYLGRVPRAGAAEGVRAAEVGDVPGIVALSRRNRRLLQGLDGVFWKPHPEADGRFDWWMQRSLTLADRDMFVTEGEIRGYAISQPVTGLHLPAPHDLEGVGIIDDFFHLALEEGDGLEAEALLRTAEAARARRGNRAVLVVCPVAWGAKRAVLQRAGYGPGLVWSVKRV